MRGKLAIMVSKYCASLEMYVHLTSDSRSLASASFCKDAFESYKL